MSMDRRNCWEVQQCGRQPGGSNVGARGICPAARLGEWDGVNRGQRAGRFCWSVAGTFCGDATQGTLAQKAEDCLRCIFLKQVQNEEGAGFALTLADARVQLETET